MSAGTTGRSGLAWPALSALLGYLFPAAAMLAGAWLGALSDGSDGAAALGAIAGFLAALAAARVVLGLLPAPQPIPASSLEKTHEH